MTKIFLFLTAFLLLPFGLLAGETLWVSTSGIPNGDGSQFNPFPGLYEAIEAVNNGPAGAVQTIMVEAGYYQEDQTLALLVGGTEAQPLTIRGYNGRAIIDRSIRPQQQWVLDESGMFSVPPELKLWTITLPGLRYDLLSVSDIPQQMIHDYGKPFYHQSFPCGETAPPEDCFTFYNPNLKTEYFVKPGQYAYQTFVEENQIVTQIWFTTTVCDNPNSLDISIANSFEVFRMIVNGSQPHESHGKVDHVTLENLTFRGGSRYGIWFKGDHITIRDCTVHNVYGSGIKGNPASDQCLIENNEIFHFGWGGIDGNNVTSMTIRGNNIHSARKVWFSEFESRAHGIQIKTGARDVVIENNYIHDFTAQNGAFIIGGPGLEDGQCLTQGGSNIVVRNNLITNVINHSASPNANAIALFSGARYCRFEDNLVSGCFADYYILFQETAESACPTPLHNQNIIIKNNTDVANTLSVATFGYFDSAMLEIQIE